LNEIAFNYFHNQKYEEAIATSKKSDYIANSFGNLYLSENINKTLVLSYLALNKDQDYKLINTNLLTIKTEITKKEEDAVNSIYNLVKNESQANYQSNDSKLKNKLLTNFRIKSAKVKWILPHIPHTIYEEAHHLQHCSSGFVSLYTFSMVTSLEPLQSAVSPSSPLHIPHSRPPYTTTPLQCFSPLRRTTCTAVL
jgi:hypothetical protein